VQADVAQAGAAVQEAQATEAEATANAARARTLQNTGALSAAQISQYETAAATAKARIAAARATLAAQQLRLRYTTVVAPDDGVISARGATVGAVPPPGTELFRMIRQGRLEWRAEVTAPDLARIHPGERAVVRTADGATVGGRVRVVAPTVDPQQRTALVYVDLPPNAAMRGPLKAGMFASGTFTLGSSPALTVPAAAVVMRDGFAYVFRVNADHHVSQLKVQLGRRVGERIEIASGLAAATPVVATGAGFLNDGDLVAVVTAARRGS
jgi:RND family efflux transporter MFP subunit